MSDFTEKLSEILLQHRTEAILISQGKSNGLDIGTSAEKAIQATSHLIDTEIIGEDESLTKLEDSDTYSDEDLQVLITMRTGKNHLRKLQRLRLKGGSDEN